MVQSEFTPSLTLLRSQFIQYMLLTPTYTNILNVYAFCNTHDITWGTKGDETPAKLPSANVRPDGKVDVALPQDDNDLDAQYAAELRAFSTPAPPVVEKRSEAQSQEDYYKGFRSTVVLVWIVCNFTLGAVVLNSAGFDRIEVDKNKKNQDSTNKKASIYMAVILWSVAGLSFFRFLGMVWFLFVRMVSAPLLLCWMSADETVPWRLMTMKVYNSMRFVRCFIPFFLLAFLYSWGVTCYNNGVHGSSFVELMYVLYIYMTFGCT